MIISNGFVMYIFFLCCCRLLFSCKLRISTFNTKQIILISLYNRGDDGFHNNNTSTMMAIIPSIFDDDFQKYSAKVFVLHKK